MEQATIDTVLKVLEWIGYIAIPFTIKTVADIRDLFRKLDEAKKPDSDGGEKVTMDEIAEIIGESGIILKLILNGIKKRFYEAKTIVSE